MKNIYLKVKTKFIITIIGIIFYSIICSIIEIPWFYSLSIYLPKWLSFLIIIGLALLPGIMICLTILGIILDKPRHRDLIALDDITILVAAYNEEKSIYDTIKSIYNQNFSKKIYLNIIDNNSKDNTKSEILKGIKDFSTDNLIINYFFEEKQGKFAALNNGLARTFTKYVITLDADTFLYKNALARLVNAMVVESSNKEVGAIAGTVLVRNSRVNLLTKMQEWEYFFSIASIKRMQGLFQSTLVAQGAFSIYNTEKLKEIKGWQDSIGEDIVVTWQLLENGNKTYYEDQAIAFTNVPTSLKIFMRQRARWARGMIEGFRHFSFKKCKNFYSKVMIFLDYFLFIIDFSVSFFFIPGIILALFFKKYLIVGPMTILLLPFTLLLFLIMHLSEYYRVFKPLGLKVRKHFLGLIFFILTYSIILSPTCIRGYFQEFLGKKRKWK